MHEQQGWIREGAEEHFLGSFLAKLCKSTVAGYKIEITPASKILYKNINIGIARIITHLTEIIYKTKLPLYISYIYYAACTKLPPTLCRVPFMRWHLKKLIFQLIWYTFIREIQPFHHCCFSIKTYSHLFWATS